MAHQTLKNKSQHQRQNGPGSLAKLGRETLAFQATAGIREAILAGEYLPGEALREEVLGQRLDVSRQVIRECFHRLEAEGLVENDPFRGRFVVDWERDDLRDLLPLRVMLECYAVELAVAKFTPEFEAQLKNCYSQIVNPGLSYGQLKELDWKLHQTIWTAAGNKPLSRLLQQVTTPFFMLVNYVKHAPVSNPEQIVEREHDLEMKNDPTAHGPLVNAICRRDRDQAVDIMKKHIMESWGVWLTHDGDSRRIGVGG